MAKTIEAPCSTTIDARSARAIPQTTNEWRGAPRWFYFVENRLSEGWSCSIHGAILFALVEIQAFLRGRRAAIFLAEEEPPRCPSRRMTKISRRPLLLVARVIFEGDFFGRGTTVIATIPAFAWVAGSTVAILAQGPPFFR